MLPLLEEIWRPVYDPSGQPSWGLYAAIQAFFIL